MPGYPRPASGGGGKRSALPRRRLRVGRKIVWEEEDKERTFGVGDGGGGGREHREAGASGLWTATWMTAREVGRLTLYPLILPAFSRAVSLGLLFLGLHLDTAGDKLSKKALRLRNVLLKGIVVRTTRMHFVPACGSGAG